MSRRAWWIYLAVMLGAIPVVLGATSATVQHVAVHLYGFSSAAAVVVGMRLHRPRHRGPWIALAAGLFLFALGDVAFGLLQATDGSVPVPSAADACYLAAYPALAAAMLLLVHHRVRGADLTSALDGIMVAVGVGVLAWVFVMAPYARNQRWSVAARVILISYPALDVLLVAIVVRLLLSGGGRNPSFYLLGASAVALLVHDAMYSISMLHRSDGGDGVAVLYVVGYVLWGATALHPSMATVTDRAPAAGTARSRTTLALLVAAALTPPVTIMVQTARGVGTDDTLLAGCSVAMFVLVLYRQSLLTRMVAAVNRQLERTARRHRVLAEAATAFVGSSDETAVAEAAARAAVGLTADPGAWSSFVTLVRARPTVTAVAGPAPVSVGDPAGALVATGRPRRGSDGPGAELARVPVAPVGGPVSCYVLPVTVGGEVRGHLVVGSTTGGAGSCAANLATLDAVCSQTGLALQAVEATSARARARTERQFRSLVQNSSDLVTLLDRDAVVAYQSPAARSVLGRGPLDLVGETLASVVHPDDLASARAQFDKVVAGAGAVTAQVECRVGHADGTWRDIDTTMTNLIGDPDVGAIVLNSRDVTERRQLERELHRQAFRDPLTGLANRALFMDRVAHALDRAERLHGSIAVLFLDLDDFKLVNDSLGHPAGDELLVDVAQRLKACTRPGDTVARLGGDEFGLLLESGAMPDAARLVAERVADALTETVRVGSQEVAVRASIGIALGHPPVDKPDALLRDADLAMYMAKHNGKGRFEMFRPSMHEEAVRQLEISAELRHAIEDGELEVFYQPIVRVDDNAVVGAEALVRWHHPRRGLVAPDEFIPVAETTGLVVPLGRWVFDQACRQYQDWRHTGVIGDDFYVSVNMSARQLQDPGLLADVATVLDETGAPPGGIVLEVTESALMEDLDVALARLRGLKSLGLRLAVDDYGTGYSSLSYLRILPMDVVKIDKTFVDRVTLDRAGAAMVRSVIDLSKALGLVTIAEGVELRDQLAFLQGAGCDSVQGFLFARPLPGAEFARVLDDLRAAASTTERTIGPLPVGPGPASP